MRLLRNIVLPLLALCQCTLAAASNQDIFVVDLRDSSDVRSHAPSVLAIQVCIGLMNRKNDTTTNGYAIWTQDDLNWLEEIEQLEDPTFTPPNVFLEYCFKDVVQGRYIHYKYETQQEIIPNLVTLASVLNAVPLIKNQQPHNHKQQMVFDAEKQFAGFDSHQATSFMFQNYAHQTTAMAKMNPGYEYTKKHSLHPPLTGTPHFQSVDFFVQQKLFTFFLTQGCIPLTPQHALMEQMVKRNQPNTQQWSQPLIVYGYDDNDMGAGFGDIFEAETNCVKEHNLGQISTHFVPNLSFWARKPPIKEPLLQNQSLPRTYDPTKTYISLVIGDGDSFNKLTGRNLHWVKQRLDYCNKDDTKRNCFPLSWTINQHAASITPDLLEWYYLQAKTTQQDYFLLPPSGYLYAYPALMQEQDQQAYVQKTQQGAVLLNTTGMVDWEFTLTWKKAIHQYYPKLSTPIQGIFAVNVPFNIPTFSFGKQEFFKILPESNLVLFKPREWRGTGKTDIPMAQKSYLTEQQMADEINRHPPGTCTYLYITSDGGMELDNLYNMVELLEDHVEVVNHQVVTEMALQKSVWENQQKEEGGVSLVTTTANEEAEPTTSGKEKVASLVAANDDVVASSSSDFKPTREVPEDPKPAEKPIVVVDLRGDVRSDAPTIMAIQACTGLFNRNETVAGAAYTIWAQQDLDWLREIQNIDDPHFTPVLDFLNECLTTVAKGYIHFNYDKQRLTVPNLLTVAAVLDAIPLITNDVTTKLINQTKAKLLFDGEKVFAGFSAHDGTKYVFDRWAKKTSTMAKMDPGYDYQKSGTNPPLSKLPSLKLADLVVKDRLFNFFLLEGCIPFTQEHKLMVEMTQHDNPRTAHWPQPIPILGYDSNSFGQAGDPFEAETICVPDRNLGQVATNNASNMAFFSRGAPLSKPLTQNPSSKEAYDESTTYLAWVIGDGDNIAMAKDTRNYQWVQQRMANCANQTITNNCFPISWTLSPFMPSLTPDIVRYYYDRAKKTGQDFFLLPPSGYLYAYPAFMSNDDQATFVQKTEDAAQLFNSTGTVDWEWGISWRGAIKNFFPRYAEKEVIKGIFAVNVPFNLPSYMFGRHEYYKIIQKKGVTAEEDDSGVVLFRPREWRGTDGKGHDIPFSRKNNLSPKDMAAEVSGYPKGTVCYIYLTSDGGADLNAIYKMVGLLDGHVKVVNHEVATDLALQRSRKLQTKQYIPTSVR